MNLKELKLKVDVAIEQTERRRDDPEEVTVLVTLSESSMGPRASTGVKWAGIGFDWERNQFRLEPENMLVQKGKSLKDAKPVVKKEFKGRNYYGCPGCGQKIAKNDNFCRYCSQKLK